ncbi:MerR family transcriptional regulator [Bifidobacterium dolichotidis]|nr:MerR family transcriptional regulator [Bifidobacterium dolichotidis]
MGGLIQGELFETADSERFPRGYRGTVASKVAGITYRQLDYWARQGIVEPSLAPSHGSGSRRLYSFKDVVILAVSKRLLDVGINLQNVTQAVKFLMDKTTDQLEHTTIMCDGTYVHECTSPEQIAALLGEGKPVFGLSVTALWHRIHDELEREDYTDLTEYCDEPASQGTLMLDPIGEMAAERMQQRFDKRKRAAAKA